MENVHIGDVPELERAILIGAFAGWNDAASAATWAIKFLVNQWEATAFAEIEPDEYFDFSEARPQVRLTNGAIRRLSWPSNRFYVHRAERGAQPERRDVVLLLGEEPHFHWRGFVNDVLAVCRRCHVEDVLLLGALVAEVPHTAPVHVRGTASSQALLRRLDRASVERATYEGSTGILTVLQDAARKEGFGAASLWGSAPHYVSATPNLPVSEALLEKLDAFYNFDLRLGDLARAARRFTTRVSSLVAADPDVAAYVRELEERSGEAASSSSIVLPGDASGINRMPPGGELPSAEEVIQDVEEWLRQFRDDQGSDQGGDLEPGAGE
jgi:proteasome assembly chaperone (PAC2) family protein